MQVFNVKAYNNAGELIQRIELANSEKELREKIQKQGLIIIEFDNANQIEGTKYKKLNVSTRQLEEIFTNLAELMGHGIRLDKAIELTAKGITNSDAKFLLGSFREEIRSGNSFYQAACKYSYLFNRLYLSLIDLGEVSGQLSGVMRRISEDLRFKVSLTQKVKHALAYPCVILMVCVLAVAFIFYFVLPQLAPLFEQAASLPWYTEVLLSIARFMEKYGALVILFIIVSPLLGIFLFKRVFSNNESAQNRIYSLWGIAQFFRAVDKIRFSSSLYLTLSSGVPLSQALKLSVSSVSIPKLRQSINESSIQIKSGLRVCDALEKIKLFDPIQIGYIETGEETGTLSSSFKLISERAQSQIDDYVSTFTTILEPALILLMGGVVGSVVIGMIMSIMSVQDINL